MRYFVSETIIIDFDKVTLLKIESPTYSITGDIMFRLGIKICLLGADVPYNFYDQAADVILEAFKDYLGGINAS